MKNLLSENMLRFGTKNLTESAKRKLVFESIMQTIKEHGLQSAVHRSLLTEGDKIIGGYNYGDLANRKQYYAMMKAGKLPTIFLTYKYDASWFDNHTGASIADMAKPNYPAGDQLLRQIRSGKVGWQPSTGITVFLAKVGAQEMMQAAGTSSADRQVDDYLNQQGSGSPQ
jgi:hypothetical protein